MVISGLGSAGNQLSSAIRHQEIDEVKAALNTGKGWKLIEGPPSPPTGCLTVKISASDPQTGGQSTKVGYLNLTTGNLLVHSWGNGGRAQFVYDNWYDAGKLALPQSM
jgi:hypothetical protein